MKILAQERGEEGMGAQVKRPDSLSIKPAASYAPPPRLILF